MNEILELLRDILRGFEKEPKYFDIACKRLDEAGV